MRIPTLRAKINEAASSARRRIVSAMPSMSMASAAAIPANQASNQSAGERWTTIGSTRGAGVGLLLCAWSAILVMSIIGGAIALAQLQPQLFMQYRYFLGGGLIGATLLGLAGMMTCGSIPKETRARGWIRMAIVLTILNLAVAGGLIYCAIQRISLQVPELAINGVVAGLGLLTFLSIMFFMKNAARSTGRPELAATARGIIWFQLVISSVSIGMVALAQTMPATESLATLIQVLGWCVLGAVVINQVVLLVLQFQLGSHLRRRVA